MSILIKGMEMPTEGTVIAIYKLNGKYYASVHGTELCPLVSIPPHGRLIDADAMLDAWDDNHTIPSAAAKVIEKTIIPAEEEK